MQNFIYKKSKINKGVNTMKHLWKKAAIFMMMATMTISITACSEKESEQNTESDAVSSGTTVAESTDELEVTNDYAMDLTPLGMPLTVYLRLDEDGKFILSNTLDFETDKGSGTFQKSGEEYIMVYTFANGEEKSVSDGITASFVVTKEGSLDFSGCTSVPYGSVQIIHWIFRNL